MRNPRHLSWGVVMALSTSAVVWIVDLPPGAYVQVLLITGICALLMASAAGKGGTDWFGPLPIFAGMWFVMFVLSPIAMAATRTYNLRGTFGIEGWLPRALWLAVLGASSFTAGYALAAKFLTPRLRAELGRKDHDAILSTTRFRFIAAATTISATAFTVATFGAKLGGVSAYVYYTPILVVPGALMCFAARPPRPGLRLLGLVGMGAFVASYVQVGQRAFILLALWSLFVYAYRRRRRGRGYTLRAIAAVAILLWGFGSITAMRHQTNLGGDMEVSDLLLNSPANIWETVISGETNEMLAALAVQQATEGQFWRQRPGDVVRGIAVHWIPRALWEEKPVGSAERLYSILFPAHYAVQKANTQFSVVGDFYFDSGAIGVAIGMTAVGAALSAIHGRWGRSLDRWSRLVYAPFPVLMIIGLRGDLSLTLGIALFTYAPIVAASVVHRQRDSKPWDRAFYSSAHSRRRLETHRKAGI